MLCNADFDLLQTLQTNEAKLPIVKINNEYVEQSFYMCVLMAIIMKAIKKKKPAYAKA